MFDLQLVDILGRLNDPAIALDHATKLAKSDPSRWEAPAAAGIAQAALGQYDDSAKSLDAASRLAPAEWRPKLGAAAELSRQEGQYVRLVRDADAAVEKRQYENAARMYADAWQASPSRIQTGMQAAISFLMADQVSLAVQTLSRLRSVSTREIAEKAGLMLNELAAVAPEAKTAALQNPSAGPDAVVDVGERVRNTLGDIRSPEMKIATTPNPPLLSDPLKFIHVNDDQINNPVPDVVLMSSQSLFIIYQNRVGITTASPQYSAPENPPPFPGQAPAQQFGSAPQPPVAITPPPQETQPAAAAPSRPRLEFRPEPYVAPPASAAPPANPPAAAPPAAAPVAPPTPPKTGPPPGAV
jgi:hypothetical protein